MEKNDARLYRITRPIITVLFKFFFRPTIKGVENISDGKLVLAGNHTSILDCLLLISSTKRSIHFLAKKELWRFPKNIIFAHMGLIPVDRSIHDKNALLSAYEYLNNGSLVLVFPEGTTEKGRGVLPFKIGAVKMASVTNSKITPFVIKGKYKIFKKSISIEFLKQLTINKDNKDLSEENEALEKIIKKELEG